MKGPWSCRIWKQRVWSLVTAKSGSTPVYQRLGSCILVRLDERSCGDGLILDLYSRGRLPDGREPQSTPRYHSRRVRVVAGTFGGSRKLCLQSISYSLSAYPCHPRFRFIDFAVPHNAFTAAVSEWPPSPHLPQSQQSCTIRLAAFRGKVSQDDSEQYHRARWTCSRAQVEKPLRLQRRRGTQRAARCRSGAISAI